MNNDDLADGLSLNDLETIDRICTCFEQQWQHGTAPRLETLVGTGAGLSGSMEGVADEAVKRIRSALISELVKLDVDYRWRNGDHPQPADYLERYPQDAAAIESAFAVGLTVTDSPPEWSVELTSRFEVERFHARGGLGEIFIALEAPLGRRVALKFPRGGTDDSAGHSRLLREAQITGRLKHPGIVPVYACSSDRSSPTCYAMQFIAGQTLAEAICAFHECKPDAADFGGWEFRRLLQRLVAVCNTVAYAHEQGVIHRDIKPSNIMLGDFGETFLLDWGVAKVLADHDSQWCPMTALSIAAGDETLQSKQTETVGQTLPGQPIGTPEFASPEQIGGRIDEQGPASDVYSLGATLYFLLTGQRAIEIEDLTNLSTASAVRRIQAPRVVNKRIPPALNAICMKAIAYEPMDRYPSALALGNDLERFLADERVSVSLPGWTTSLRRMVRRKPRLASSLATATVLALLGTSLGAWMLNEKADELAVALDSQKQTSTALQQAKDSAEGYANDAMDALRTLSGRVVKQWFAEQESFSQTEREFLQQIVEQYQDLARAQSDGWFSRAIQAEAFHAVAQIQMLLGQDADAMLSIDRVIDLLTPMPDDAGHTPRVLKATIIFDRGKLLFAGSQRQAGTRDMMRGIDMLEALTGDFPEEAGFRETLANAIGKLGATHVTAHQWDLAIEQFRRAQAITADLVARHPENFIFLAAHESKTSNLGVALANSGDHEAAMIEFQAASGLYDELFKRDAIFSDVYRASGVPVHHIAVANSLIHLKRTDEAVESFERARQVAQQLTSLYPMFPGGFVSLARAHHGLAANLMARRDFETAVSESTLAAEAVAKAVAISAQQPNFHVRRVIQRQLAYAHEKNGDRSAADAAFLRLIQFDEEQLAHFPNPENSMSTAGDYLRLVKYQKFAQQKPAAITSLERAIELFEAIPESSPLFPTAQSFLRKSKSDLAELVAAPHHAEEK